MTTPMQYKKVIVTSPKPKEQCQAMIIKFEDVTRYVKKLDLKPYFQVQISHSAN